VTIVWRGNYVGFMQQHDVERVSSLREHHLDDLAVTLAGRAAEEVCCGTISGYASSDLVVVSVTFSSTTMCIAVAAD
jgi:ATP-dependent Zn protease